MKAGLIIWSRLITRFESGPNYTQLPERKPAEIAPAGFSYRAKGSELERETRAQLDDARFTCARVFPEVRILSAVAIANDGTGYHLTGGSAAEVEVHRGELGVVQGIECLKAQLQVQPFVKPRVLGENKVKVVHCVTQPELVEASRSATEVPCQNKS